MKHFSSIRLWFFFLLGSCYGSISGANWFVKTTGTGAGTSWDDALSPESFASKLKSGFDNGDIVYLAAGAYYPGIAKTDYFSITKGVTLIGGFAPNITGNITEISYPSIYETFLSGDIDKNEKLDVNNSNQVVIVNSSAKVTFKGISITGAYKTVTGDAGAGLDIRAGGNVDMYFCKIIRNLSTANSAGAYATASRLYCYKTIVSENRANNRGAGIRIQDASGVNSNLILESCLLINNTLDTEWGGAIQVSGSGNTVYCTNTTIANNTAGKGGAGINSPGPVYIVSSTIVNNVCSDISQGQDIRCESVDKMMIINSIISGKATNTPNIFLNGSDKKIVSKGNNIIGTVGGTGSFTTQATDQTGKYISDIFGENVISEYGGFPKTIALNENILGSPLTNLESFKSTYNVSADVHVDQRGYTRPLTTSVGAFEFTIPFNLTKTERLLKDFKDAASKYVFVVAHRAGWRYYPENSVEAIANAAQIGVDMVEIDVQKTKDGEFILMHDNTVDRMTNGTGNISDKTLAELKELRLKDANGNLTNYQIPSLREALVACKENNILANLDKGGDYLADITPLLRETETENIVLLKGTNSVATVKTMLGSNMNLMYMPVTTITNDADVTLIGDFLDNFGPTAVEVNFATDDFPNLSYTKTIKARGTRVWCNTLWDSLCGGHTDDKSLSDPDNNWGWILAQDATVIQTDRIKELIDYLKSKGYRGTRTMKIMKAADDYTPTMDGKGSDPIWTRIAPISISNLTSGTTDGSHTAEFKSFWTNNGIYFYCNRTDATISEKGSATNEDIFDQFRFYFNPTGIKDTEVSTLFNRPVERTVGDVYPESRSTQANVYIGDDAKMTTEMLKRWEVFGVGLTNTAFPKLTGNKGQRVIHSKNGNGYSMEFFVPFSIIIPSFTGNALDKIGFEIESIDGDGSSVKSTLSWAHDEGTNINSNINLFGELDFLSDKINCVAPLFTDVTTENDIKKMSNGSGLWGDYNNDGFLDLFYIGKDNTDINKEVAYLYKNNGNGTFSAVTTTIVGMQEAACAWIDYNNDGNLDLIVMGGIGGIDKSNASTKLYRNLGANSNYSFVEFQPTGITNIMNEAQKTYRYVKVGDFDNDGYFDIIATGQNTSGGRLTNIYRNNQGNGTFTQQNNVLSGGAFRPFSSGSVSCGDYNNDGYLDILVSGYGETWGSVPEEKGGFRVYKNNGDGTFTDILFSSDNWGTFLGDCSWIDANNDGYLDFILTGKHRIDSGDINQARIYINNGNGGFTEKSSNDINIDAVKNSGLDFADVNNDGFIDLVVNGVGAIDGEKTWVYINDGTGRFLPDNTALGNMSIGAVALADYDKDGYIDAFINGLRAGNSVAELWRNNGLSNKLANTPPSIPSNLNAILENGRVTFSWNKSTDNLTPTNALNYNLFVKKNGSNSVSIIIPSDTLTGFVKVSDISAAITNNSYTMILPQGEYIWGVQAIDNGKLGSAFAKKEFLNRNTGIDQNEKESVNIFAANGKIFVDPKGQNATSVCVLDISGKQLCQKRNVSKGFLDLIVEKGIYIIRLKTSEGETVKKIIL